MRCRNNRSWLVEDSTRPGCASAGADSTTTGSRPGLHVARVSPDAQSPLARGDQCRDCTPRCAETTTTGGSGVLCHYLESIRCRTQPQATCTSCARACASVC